MTLMSPESLFASFKANPPASPEAVSQCQSNLIDSTLDSLVNFHSLGRVNLPPASRRHRTPGEM